MSIDSVSSLGLLGVQRGLQGLRSDATQLASADAASTLGPDAIAAALVSLKQHELQVAASTHVLSTANEMVGTIIDVLA